MLKKEEILKAADLPFEDVQVPEWGGSVRVRTMTGSERDAYEVSLMDPDKAGGALMTHVRARLLVFTLVDENNQRYFTEAEIAALGGKGAKPIDRLFDVAKRLNGIGEQEVAELGKPSGAAPAGASTST